jgi:DNA (cytosine-5)-methyltransferase 1
VSTYYNENDKFGANWLRALMQAGAIPKGVVDERSIMEVAPSDLVGFTHCHFFAGIGVWAYALRQAGWPEDEPVWTGSCPCQPFSVAGKRARASDGRHLWPEWFRLIHECRPRAIFGEQVASDDGLAWLDVVSSDLENADYACGAVDTCAAGFGAPHIRQRLYFVAESERARCGARRIHLRSGESREEAIEQSRSGELADAAESRFHQAREHDGGSSPFPARSQQREQAGDMADAARGRFGVRGSASRDGGRPALGEQAGHVGEPVVAGLERHAGDVENGDESRWLDARPDRSASTASFWSDADWIPCRDNTYRPIEPGTFPLAHGVAGRVGRLRGYGNALCAPQAIAFIEAYLALKCKS